MKPKAIHGLHGHGFDVFTAQHEQLREANDAARAERALFAAQIRAADAARLPRVYAVLRAELPLVKIGTTTNLAGRDGRLRRMPGCTLVALTLGGHPDERAVHQRLAEHRVKAMLRGSGHGEHFTLSGPVVDWVNETRRTLGLDVLVLDDLMSQYRE